MFGGLLIGQALRAAQLTVPDDRPAHSLHLSFAVAGTGGEAIRYEVERTRDGSSFATRRVVARQARGIVAVLTADFHDDEPGVEYETPATPGIPGPEGLPVGRYDNPYIESRDVPVLDGDRLPHTRRAWFRPTAPVPDDPLLHLQALAYLSDHGPTRAAREPHAGLADDARRMSVSLDHSVWFHRRSTSTSGCSPSSSRSPPAVAAACRSARSAPPTARCWRPSPRRSSCAAADTASVL